MKNILYKIFPICLLTMGLTGCEEETKYRPLPEIVPLTMSINDNAFAMGEHLKVNINVEPDADGKEVVANEDFDIYFTAKAGTEDASNVFEQFNGIVTFPKGEKQIQVDFPIKASGLTGSTAINFTAFARGYKMEGSSQVIKVSDYYRIMASLESNAENVVMEGGKFVLVAKIEKPSSVPLNMKITPKEGEGDRYENLPSTLTIPAGRTSAKSDAVTIKQDFEMTGDLQLVLNLESDSPANPMINSTLTITMTDLESMGDPNLFDITKVYEFPDRPFMSDKNKTAIESWFTGDKIAMNKNSAHPTSALKDKDWVLCNAIEFHYINNSFSGGNNTPNAFGHRISWAFSDINDAPSQKIQAVNNAKCTNITNEGILNMWVDKNVQGTGAMTATKDYGVAALQCSKFGGIFAPQHTRFFPGMRIEVKARLRGIRTGFVPTIGLKNQKNSLPNTKDEIDILKNTQGSVITQAVTVDNEIGSKSVAIPQANEWNIYWVELVDENIINLGINGATNLTVNRTQSPDRWPFDKAGTPATANPDPATAAGGSAGLYFFMRLAESSERAAGKAPEGWDNVLKSIANCETDDNTPRMEIDWIRIYTNKNYVQTDAEKVWANQLFY
ncbi:DUF5006 domain-containing protein [Bacteroides ovatus]|uniref:DUF5006 domain-containing protein n=1 Tax=Bacteroides ovatus TaxID=28116 RepID=UPI00321BCF35